MELTARRGRQTDQQVLPSQCDRAAWVGGELREREEGHLSLSGGGLRGLPGGSSTQAETRRASGKEQSGMGVEETAHGGLEAGESRQGPRGAPGALRDAALWDPGT